MILFALLLCLGLTGCGKALPAPAPTGASLPRPIPPEAAPTVSALEPTEAPLEPSPEVAQWLPPFAMREQWSGGATYENVREDDVAAYAAALEAGGFQSCGTLFYTDHLIFTLSPTQESGVYTVEWYEADPSAPVPDREAVQALLPDRELICLVDQTPAGMYAATGLRRLVCVCSGDPTNSMQPAAPDGNWCKPHEYLLGASACVPMQGYFESSPHDPLWADLDGDGAAEYVYWSYGPTSGLFTVALWAYGTEQGIPVIKGVNLLNLHWGEVGLEKAGEATYFRYRGQQYDRESGEDVPQPEQLIPLWIENGWIAPKDRALTDGIEFCWGGPTWDCMGQSFQAVRARMEDWLVYDSPHCIVWTDALLADAPEDVTTYAAVTNNGVSVTGYLSFRASDHMGFRAGVTPIQTPDNPEALAALDWPELEERLGPCHFDNGSGLYLAGWFTEDGKLLCINGAPGAWRVSLTDPADLAVLDRVETPFELIVENDSVFVFDGVPTRIINERRWQSFLTATENGQSDALTLCRHDVEDESTDDRLHLSYDGKLFTLDDGEQKLSYPYLLISEENNPPAQASFHHAIYYLLSEDPEMSWSRYFAHMISSQFQPDFPPTTVIFTRYID